MSGKVVVVVTLLAALLASSASSAPEESNILRKLLVKKERMSETSNKQEPAPRTERRAHLSGDEREIMTKQIMQAISEMMNSDCVLSRDYQGWVDFGRRDAQ